MRPGCDGLPTQQLRVRALEAGLSAREKAGQPGEVRGCVVGRDGNDWNVEVPTDHLRDGVDRHAFVSDRVQGRARGRVPAREAEQTRQHRSGARPASG